MIFQKTLNTVKTYNKNSLLHLTGIIFVIVFEINK